MAWKVKAVVWRGHMVGLEQEMVAMSRKGMTLIVKLSTFERRNMVIVYVLLGACNAENITQSLNFIKRNYNQNYSLKRQPLSHHIMQYAHAAA